MSDEIRNILKGVADNPNLLQRLIREPRQVAEEFGLDSAQTEQLVHSDVLIAAVRNPLVERSLSTQTLGTITITVTIQHLEDSE